MIAFLRGIKPMLFIFDLVIHCILLMGIIWSVTSPQKRIWPPPNKRSWQYIMTWVCFYAAFSLNGLLILLDWNSWVINEYARFFIGIPFVIVGSWLLLWGISTIGSKNTAGLKDGFIRSGPYRFTRNPQYLGDILTFIGLIFISNSRYLIITNSLLILTFLITPLAEEIWLEKQYGENYLDYKKNSPRFL